MKNLLATALICLVWAVGFSQDHWCASDQYFAQQVAEDPQIALDRAQLVEAIHQGAALKGSREGEKHIVPVVFHIIWDECVDDISLAQIKDGLRIVNEDLNRLNADASETRAEFVDFAADSEIELRLARIDPDGNPTDGIVRVQSAQANNASNSVKSLSYWPSNNYFNIWVVSNIQNFTGGTGTILGYAQFPGSGSWNTYGVVIRNDAVGTIGTSTADGRTLTHEVGHTFNLYHTFQSGCGGNCSSSGDFICDTPPSAESSSGCNFSNNSCSNDASGSAAYSSNVPDMIENYMSYDDCQNIFTQGQKEVMKASLNGVNNLIQLTSQENLEATGVVGLVRADYVSEQKVYCANYPTQFYDQTFYDPESLSWTFPGDASPNSSTDENPVTIFTEPGLKNITLEAQLSGETETLTTNDRLLIVDQAGQYGPFVDDMEDVTFLPTEKWFPVNLDEDALEWKLSTTAALSGTHSLMMENYGSCGELQDDLITQSFDLSTFTSVEVKFSVAFAQRQATDNDFLRMYISTDCGATWQLSWVQGSSALAGATAPQDAPFVPFVAADWTEFSINLNSPLYMVEGVIFKFQFVGRGGNNLYLDDFSIDGVFSDELLLRAPVDGKQGLTKQVTLDWKAVRGVDSYEFQLDQTPDFNSAALIQGSNVYIDDTPVNSDTEFEAAALDLGATYFWRVRYIDGGTPGEWSETWSFEVSETGVGIEDRNEGVLSVFPNPATGVVNVQTDEVLTRLTLVDVSGRTVRAWSPAKQLDVSGIDAGVYSLIIETSNDRHNRQLVIR